MQRIVCSHSLWHATPTPPPHPTPLPAMTASTFRTCHLHTTAGPASSLSQLPSRLHVPHHGRAQAAVALQPAGHAAQQCLRDGAAAAAASFRGASAAATHGDLAAACTGVVPLAGQGWQVVARRDANQAGPDGDLEGGGMGKG
jgi:hypothetical protein